MQKRTRGEKVFDGINIAILVVFTLVTFYPLYFVVCASLSSNSVVESSAGILLWPTKFTVGAYVLALRHPLIYTSLKNILVILAMSLPINFLLTLFCAYFLAARKVLFKVPIVLLMTFTMFFSGGLVPSYLNIRRLGLYNTYWALVLPFALSLYNAIITKTAIEGMPESLSESAYIDGANDITVLFRIILPLILPTMAVIMLYYTVGQWNSWFPATIYIQTQKKMPLQVILRAILIQSTNLLNEGNADLTLKARYTETIKYAAIVMSTVPILMVYPFIQKYFTKGVMIGAIKG